MDSRRHTIRGTALVAMALTGAGCTPFDDVMVAVFGRSMREQSSIGSYEAGPRLPPEGSVPFASGNFPSAEGVVNLGQPEGSAMPPSITGADVGRALAVPDSFPHIVALPNPVAATPESLARGEQVFNRACSPCHGVTGGGEGAVGQAFAAFARSLLLPNVQQLSDGYIYSLIRAGRGLMPPYGHQVSHFDRWHVVNYVRQLQGL